MYKMLLYSIIGITPYLQTYYGSFDNELVCEGQLDEYIKKYADEIPPEIIFCIYSHDLNASLPVNFILIKQIQPYKRS